MNASDGSIGSHEWTHKEDSRTWNDAFYSSACSSIDEHEPAQVRAVQAAPLFPDERTALWPTREREGIDHGDHHLLRQFLAEDSTPCPFVPSQAWSGGGLKSHFEDERRLPRKVDAARAGALPNRHNLSGQDGQSFGRCQTTSKRQHLTQSQTSPLRQRRQKQPISIHTSVRTLVRGRSKSISSDIRSPPPCPPPTTPLPDLPLSSRTNPLQLRDSQIGGPNRTAGSRVERRSSIVLCELEWDQSLGPADLPASASSSLCLSGASSSSPLSSRSSSSQQHSDVNKKNFPLTPSDLPEHTPQQGAATVQKSDSLFWDCNDDRIGSRLELALALHLHIDGHEMVKVPPPPKIQRYVCTEEDAGEDENQVYGFAL